MSYIREEDELQSTVNNTHEYQCEPSFSLILPCVRSWIRSLLQLRRRYQQRDINGRNLHFHWSNLEFISSPASERVRRRFFELAKRLCSTPCVLAHSFWNLPREAAPLLAFSRSRIPANSLWHLHLNEASISVCHVHSDNFYNWKSHGNQNTLPCLLHAVKFP